MRSEKFASRDLRQAVKAFDDFVRDFHETAKTDASDDRLASRSEHVLPDKRKRVASAYEEVQRLINGELERA